jgi:sodium-coupled neutral amino acid transporter 9
MCGKLMGRFWEYLGSFFSLLAVTGAAVVYWVLMSNFLYNSITYIYGKFIGFRYLD